MSNFPARIQQAIDEGYEFNFGDYISRGFTLVGRDLGGFIAFFLVYILISAVLGLIPILGLLASLVINPALSVGPYIVAGKIDRDESTQFGDFFKGFDKLGQLFLSSLLTGLLILLAMIPGFIVIFLGAFASNSGADVGLMSILAFLLFLAPVAYLAVSYSFAPMFIWFYDMEAWTAMEASRKVLGRQWFIMLAFLFVLALVAAAGLILLVVGVLYTAPAVMCALYAAFADITRLNDEYESEDDVIDHFVPTGS